MANPNLPIAPEDLRFEERSGCFVLIDPLMAEGRRDVAAAWEEAHDRWRVRHGAQAPTGAPYPVANCRDTALDMMLSRYCESNPDAAARLHAQRFRLSFGYPQIFGVTR